MPVVFIKTILSRFLRDKSGAVTVDFVVLTAATVGFGFVTAAAVLTDAGDNLVSYASDTVDAELAD